MSIRWFLQSAILLWLLGRKVMCLGVFEVSLVKLHNHRGVLYSGRCCSGSSSYPPCTGHCDTFVTACLMHHVQFMPMERVCRYGNATTGVVGGNNIGEGEVTLISIPVELSWPGNFTLIFETWHAIEGSVRQKSDTTQLILQSFIPTTIRPSKQWKGDTTKTPKSEQQIRYRLLCKEHYHGTGCDVFCRSRDDKYGHHTCSETGTKECRAGWKGPFCDQPVCSDECYRNKGMCEGPDRCRCRLGWTGGNCEKCKTNPGCLHGYCHQPYQCICRGGWTGRLCDIDSDYCSKAGPCQNSGTCISDPIGNYTCMCAPGYTGNNCQYTVCYEGYCQNGHCMNNGLRCSCDDGYYGNRCQHKKHSCEDIHCQNGGQCVSRRHGGGRCICRESFTGNTCDRNISPCDSNPCRNGSRCVELAPYISIEGYTCTCPPGFTGSTCSVPINPCAEVNCLHGGTCVFRGNVAKCECRDSYTGQFCEMTINPCKGIKCLNSGACKTSPMGNGFICSCAIGYYGEMCQLKMRPCASSPCLNGGVCKDHISTFKCKCSGKFSGKLCEHEKLETTSRGPASHLTTSTSPTVENADDNLDFDTITDMRVISGGTYLSPHRTFSFLVVVFVYFIRCYI